MQALFFLDQYVQALGSVGLLLLYFTFHFIIGLLLPYRSGAKPYFFLWIEKIGLDLDRRLNRESRSSFALFVRGSVILLIMGGLAIFLGFFLKDVASIQYGWFFYLVLFSFSINFMIPIKTLRFIMRFLSEGREGEALELLRPYSFSFIQKKDAGSIIRYALEFMILSLNQFFVAPILWFLFAGPVGVLFYITVSALYTAFGEQSGKGAYFSKSIRMVNTCLNIIPSFLIALVFVFAAIFVSKSNPFQALKVIFFQARYYSPFYRGLPMAAVAGGLGVILGGPLYHQKNYVQKNPWLGPEKATAKLRLEDLIRGEILLYVFFICIVAMHSLSVILTI